jgi:hypothetical protein
MKIKTSLLQGKALDYAVGVANECAGLAPVQYSTRWEFGGTIIEREKIDVRYRIGVNMTANIGGQYEQTAGHRESANPMLLAAMRCYVASKLGDEVEIPNELKGESNV